MGGNLEKGVVRFKISWEIVLFCTQIELAPNDGKWAVFLEKVYHVSLTLFERAL